MMAYDECGTWTDGATTAGPCTLLRACGRAPVEQSETKNESDGGNPQWVTVPNTCSILIMERNQPFLAAHFARAAADRSSRCAGTRESTTGPLPASLLVDSAAAGGASTCAINSSADGGAIPGFQY